MAREDEVVLEAEMAVEGGFSAQREQRQLNIALAATALFIIVMMIIASIFSIGLIDDMDGNDGSGHWLPPVDQRANLDYRNDDVFSRVSWNGSLKSKVVIGIHSQLTTR